MCKKASILLGVVLALTVAASCSSGSGSDPAPIPVTAATYTVSFDTDGGTPIPPDQTVTAGGTATMPETNPEKGDYFFAGWYTSNGTLYTFTSPVNSDITLTAKWQCTITLDANGGIFTDSGDSTETVRADIASPITIPAVTKTDAGGSWNLLGWTLDTTTSPVELYDTAAGTNTNITLHAVWTQSFVVTFDSAGGSPTPASQAVESGESASEPGTNPSKAAYIFRFWSANGTTEYNFSTPVTANVELTAIYGLDIDSVSVDRDDREITVDLPSMSTTPDAAEIWFIASVNGGASIPVTATRTSYNTSSDTAFYTFDPFVSSSTSEDLSVVITAHTSATTAAASAFTIPQLVPVTGLTATPGDQTVTLSWDAADYTDSYQIVCSAISFSASTTMTSYQFAELENGTEYTFEVYRIDGNDTESPVETISATPAITVQNSNWLFIMYLDGDNDLHDYLWTDLNEMEQGLGNKDASTSINVVVLWDGWTGDSNETPQYASEHTRIYQLGPQNRAYYLDPNTVLESGTIDLTSTASWIVNNEVDMSSQATLENFLGWVQERYTADNIVLGFSNHGGGPRSAPLKVRLADGRTVSMPTTRAMCWDESNGGSEFLSTNAVSDALTNQGYTGTDKLSMLMLDVCLGGSVEEAYQYRNNADFFVASPNNIPGGGFNYCDLIRQTTAADTPTDVGKQLVYDYYHDYSMSSAEWSSAMSYYGCSADKIDFYFKGTTLTCVDLTGMDAVKTAIDALADVILGTGGDELWLDSNGDPTVDTRSEVIRDGLFKYDTAPGAFMSYMGTYTWLYDIGFMAEHIKDVFGSAQINSWPAAYSAADAVLTALETAVAWAAKDSYQTLYRYSNIHSATAGIARGLTICGETVNIDISGGSATLVDGVSPDFYVAGNLEFATTSSWKDLLDEWFDVP